MPAPTIRVQPTVAAPTDTVLVAWSGKKATRVRIEWSTGAQLLTANGPGSAKVTVPDGATGTAAIKLLSGRYQLASTELRLTDVAGQFPDERPPPPPPPDPDPPPPPPQPAPIVTAVAPLAGSTDKAISVNVKATFDVSTPLDATSVTNGNVHLRDHLGADVAGAVSYDAVARQIIFDPTANLANSETYTLTLTSGTAGIRTSTGGIFAADYSWSFTTVASPAGAGLVVLGWAARAPFTVVGGGTATPTSPTTWAAYKTALQGAGSRVVTPAGSANFDANSDSFNVDNDHLTIDGSGFHGSFREYDVQFKGNDLIITNLRLRAGDQFSNPNDQDCLTINPGSGNKLQGVVIDHCSIIWSLDMCIALLNWCEYVTIQHCIIGCGLRLSTKPDNPKGLGTNVSVPNNNSDNEATEHSSFVTFYRNFVLNNFQRNMKFERAALGEYLNNVYSNWGNQVGHGNSRSINVIQNYFRKGANTTTSEVWADDDTYPPFANSVYFPFAQNLFRNLNGSAFTPSGQHIGTSEERSTPNAGSGLVAATMTDALADQIVADAGPLAVDSIDQTLKDDWTNKTGTFYNGIGNPAPNPSYPAPF